MKMVKEINDFKRFIELNRDRLYASAEKADDIALDDEWMQEDQDKNDDIVAFVKTKCK